MGVEMMQVGARQGAVGTSNRYHWQQPLGATANPRGTDKTDFPIVPVPPDRYDDVANIKNQYAHMNQGNTNWVVPFTESDAAFLMRKRNIEERAQFDMWIQQKYNLADPAQNMMLQQIAPDLYQRREEVIDTQQDMVSRYAKMRLRGAKSIDDLYFEWLIETGRLTLPKGPIWDPVAWRKAQFDNPRGDPETDRQANRQRYYAGFFSPLKWMSNSQAGREANSANYFDVTGTDTRYENHTGGNYFSGSGDVYGARYPNVFGTVPSPFIAAVPGDGQGQGAVAAIPAAVPGQP